jgi:hypothetical protein
MGLLVKFGDFVFWWLKKTATKSPKHQIPTKGFIYLHDNQSYLNRTHVK